MGHRISLPKSSKQGEFAFLLKSVKFSQKTEMTKNLFYFSVQGCSQRHRGLPVGFFKHLPLALLRRDRGHETLSQVFQISNSRSLQLVSNLRQHSILWIHFRYSSSTQTELIGLETVSAEVKKIKNVELPFKSVDN